MATMSGVLSRGTPSNYSSAGTYCGLLSLDTTTIITGVLMKFSTNGTFSVTPRIWDNSNALVASGPTVTQAFTAGTEYNFPLSSPLTMTSGGLYYPGGYISGNSHAGYYNAPGGSFGPYSGVTLTASNGIWFTNSDIVGKPQFQGNTYLFSVGLTSAKIIALPYTDGFEDANTTADMYAEPDGGAGTWARNTTTPYAGSYQLRNSSQVGSHRKRFDMFQFPSGTTKVAIKITARANGILNDWTGGSPDIQNSTYVSLWNETDGVEVANSLTGWAAGEMSNGTAASDWYARTGSTITVDPAKTYRWRLYAGGYDGKRLTDIDNLEIFIPSSPNHLSTRHTSQRKLDVCQNGNRLTTYMDALYNARFRLSSDGGVTWSEITGMTIVGVENIDMFVDLDDYCHVSWKQTGDGGGRNNGRVYYMRGTPNTGRTSWNWDTPFVIDAASTGYDHPSLVAHREGTGWRAHIVMTYIDQVYYSRLDYTSAGVRTQGSSIVVAGSSGSGASTYPTIDFNHTGDSKTVAGSTPHLYVGWSAGTTGAGKGIRFKKATYSAGAWTWGTEREIDNTHYTYNHSGVILSMFDGTRVVFAGPARSSTATWDMVIHDRDAADTTTTLRTPVTGDVSGSNAVPYYASASYDAGGNVYLVGGNYSANGGTLRKWNRASNTLDAPVLDSAAITEGYFSMKRGYSGNKVEWVYTSGNNSPYTIKYSKYNTTVPPNTPTSLQYIYEPGRTDALVSAYISSGNQSQQVRGTFSIYQGATLITYAASDFRVGDGTVTARMPISLSPGTYTLYAMGVNEAGEASAGAASITMEIYSTVSKTGDIRWNVRSTVSDTVQQIWNTRTSVFTTDQYIWRVLTPVAKTNNELWHTRSTVSRERQLLWTTRAGVFTTEEFIWNTRTSLFTTDQYLWHTRALAGNSVQLRWGQGGSVYKDLSLSWNTRERIFTTEQFIWNTRFLVPAKTYNTLWHVRAAVGNQRQVLWNTRAVTADTLNTLWNVRNSVFTTDQYIWNTRIRVSQSRALLWNVRSSTVKTNSQLWNTRSKVFNDEQFVWNVRRTVGQSVNLKFRAISLFAQLTTPLPEYYFEIVSSGPIAYWRMDDEIPATFDSSGFGRHLTQTGTVVNAAPLVTGGYAKEFVGSATAYTDLDNMFIQGSESKPFTIEAWVQSVGQPTTDRLLVGRGTDGLFLVPEGFEFRISNSLGEDFVVPFVVGTWDKRHHVVATFGGNEMYMFVDTESSVPVTFNGNFNNTSSTLYVGGNGTGDSVILDEVAVYGDALYNNTISRHYFAGVRKPNYENVVTTDGGVYWPLTDQMSTVALDYTQTDLPVAENAPWTSEIIDLGELGVIAGSRLDWEATNDDILVETSTNLGVSWQPAVNHGVISGLGAGVNTTTKFLQIRATRTDTTNPYPPQLDRVHATIYRAKESRSVNYGLPAILTNGVSLAERDYNALSEYRPGAIIAKGNSITLPALPTESPARTLEVWVRLDAAPTATGGTGEYFVDARNALANGWMALVADNGGEVYVGGGWSQVYINGVLKTPLIQDFPVGEWIHLVLVSSTGWNGPVVLGQRFNYVEGSAISVAHPALYSNVLTPSQISKHAVAGYSKNYATALDSDLLTITDVEPNVYARSWEVVSSG